MNQENVTAIVIKQQDYKDNDKMLRLFTLESGVVFAVAKGVKKANAKLKFASQVFSFCNFSLIKNPKTGYLTVAGAVSIEDMFAITQDIDKFLPACVCLEAVDNAVKDEANAEVFILLLKTLKTILYSGEISPKASACFFLAKLLKLGGFVSFESASLKSVVGRINSAREVEEIVDISTAAAACFKDVAKIFEKSFSTKLLTLKSVV